MKRRTMARRSDEYDTLYQCKRCKHSWTPRKNPSLGKPLVCPRCHSPYWDEEKQRYY